MGAARLGSLLMGSVAQRVMHLAKVPVVLVK
jgi:nucleotide-binding universal stress UspA family protein